jgi:hypothetical protein
MDKRVSVDLCTTSTKKKEYKFDVAFCRNIYGLANMLVSG